MGTFSSPRRLLFVGASLGIVASVLIFEFRRAPRDNAIKHASVITSPATSHATPALNARVVSNQPERPAVPHRVSDGDAGKILIPPDRPHFLGATSPASVKAGQNDVMVQAAAESLRNYRLAFKQNPVGNNTDITRTLSGKNPRHTRYLPPESRINSSGELVDSLDQPIFFHQISSTLMEIRSAGPDRVMWTSDDEVLR